VTREAASDSGTELTIEGGRLLNVVETGAPEGTLVTVRQLFFNTPARRKFLKSIATEMAHIADILASMALAWPQVQFRLTHNERVVKSWPAVTDPFERAADVLGGVPRGDLHAVESNREGISVSGWISHPRAFRKSANGIFILVNRRFVRDRLAQHALFQGYSQRLVKGQFPLAVLLIEVPCDQVDVNVHPAKSEVRFARPNDVHELIRRAVAQTLYDIDRPAWKPVGYRETGLKTSQVSEEAEGFAGRRPVGGAFSPDGRSEADSENRGWKAAPTIKDEQLSTPVPFVGEASSLDDRGKMPLPPTTEEAGIQSPASGRPAQSDLWERRGFDSLRVIGQLHHTYIICEARDGMILIDQHAAHERVLYEQLTRRAENQRPPSQALLVPETVELGFREAQALEILTPHLAELGLEVEPFGGGTVVVKSIPGFLSGRDIRPLLTEMAEAAGGSAGPADPQAVLDFCRQRAACHGAIRAGQALSLDQMQTLLRQLDECGNLSHCPHGRPTWLRYDIGMIERGFRRVV
jgi:DNA mismatch repair protein MutL